MTIKKGVKKIIRCSQCDNEVKGSEREGLYCSVCDIFPSTLPSTGDTYIVRECPTCDQLLELSAKDQKYHCPKCLTAYQD